MVINSVAGANGKTIRRGDTVTDPAGRRGRALGLDDTGVMLVNWLDGGVEWVPLTGVSRTH